MKRLTEFYKGTTKEFDIIVYYKGKAQNVVNDDVKLHLTDTTPGQEKTTTFIGSDKTAEGKVSFLITSTESKKLKAKQYAYMITWEPTGRYYIIAKDNVKVLEA